MSAEETALYNMSDEELESAFKEAKAEMDSPDVVEDDTVDEIDEVVVDDVEEPDVDEDEVDEIEEIDATEQPDEDSDTDGTEIEDGGEPGESDEPDDLEEGTEDVEDKDEEVAEVEEVAKYKVKANGNEFDLTAEELIKLAPKAMDYTKKMQEIAPWRKTISALKENNIEHADINLMIDALKGNPDAVTAMLKKAGVDALTLDTEKESTYTPKEYGLSDQALDIKDLESRISGDAEFSITTNVVNEQWDYKSRDEMFKNPKMIEGLHSDIKSGTYDKVSPMASKLKMLDGGMKSDLEYYKEAGRTYFEGLNAEEATKTAQVAQEKAAQETEAKAAEVKRVKDAQTKQAKVKADAKVRKAAAPVARKAGKSVIDYLDDSDDSFDDWYKQLQDRQ